MNREGVSERGNCIKLLANQSADEWSHDVKGGRSHDSEELLKEL